MEEISTVKKELKELRKNMSLLDALASSDARNAKRLDMLKASPQSEAVQAEIARIRRSLDSVCAKKLSCDIMRLEEKYMRAINSLPSFDKTIFLEFFKHNSLRLKKYPFSLQIRRSTTPNLQKERTKSPFFFCVLIICQG